MDVDQAMGEDKVEAEDKPKRNKKRKAEASDEEGRKAPTKKRRAGGKTEDNGPPRMTTKGKEVRVGARREIPVSNDNLGTVFGLILFQCARCDRKSWACYDRGNVQRGRPESACANCNASNVKCVTKGVSAENDAGDTTVKTPRPRRKGKARSAEVVPDSGDEQVASTSKGKGRAKTSAQPKVGGDLQGLVDHMAPLMATMLAAEGSEVHLAAMGRLNELGIQSTFHRGHQDWAKWLKTGAKLAAAKPAGFHYGSFRDDEEASDLESARLTVDGDDSAEDSGEDSGDESGEESAQKPAEDILGAVSAPVNEAFGSP